jgi:hypothetical protein
MEGKSLVDRGLREGAATGLVRPLGKLEGVDEILGPLRRGATQEMGRRQVVEATRGREVPLHRRREPGHRAIQISGLSAGGKSEQGA